MKYILIIIVILSLHSCSLEKRRYTRGFYSHRGVISFIENDKTDIKPYNTKLPEEPEGKKIDPGTEIYPDKDKKIEIESPVPVSATDDSLLVISDKVGDFIDYDEKIKYKLFPSVNNTDFVSAQFKMDPNNKIRAEITLKDGTVKIQSYSLASYQNLAKNYFSGSPEVKKEDKLSETEKIDRQLTWNAVGKFFIILGLIFTNLFGSPIFIPLIITNSLRCRKLKLSRDGYTPDEKKEEAMFIFQKARKIAIAQLIGLPVSAASGVFLSAVLGALFGFGFDWGLALIFGGIGFYSIFILGTIILTILYLMIQKRLKENPYPEIAVKMKFLKTMLLISLFLILAAVTLLLLFI